jgi:rod shape-determining protein MreC
VLKRTHYLAALGTVLLLVLVLLNLPAPAAARVKLAVGGFFLPLFGVASGSQNFVDRASYDLLPRATLVAEVQRLERENADLRLAAAQGADAIAENNRLRSQFGALSRLRWKPRLCRVVGRDASTWWRTAVIDYGSRDGAQINQTVVANGGLVGRISAVGYSHSQIALIGDADCGVSISVAETRDHGVIKGSQSTVDAGVAELTMLQNCPQVMPGHTIVTSGLGGVFPGGLAVGTILDTRPSAGGLYTTARVRLLANLNRLDEVWVLLP